MKLVYQQQVIMKKGSISYDYMDHETKLEEMVLAPQSAFYRAQNIESLEGGCMRMNAKR